MLTKGLYFMKGLSTEQNVHKSMNIVHDLATLVETMHAYVFVPCGPDA